MWVAIEVAVLLRRYRWDEGGRTGKLSNAAVREDKAGMGRGDWEQSDRTLRSSGRISSSTRAGDCHEGQSVCATQKVPLSAPHSASLEYLHAKLHVKMNLPEARLPRLSRIQSSDQNDREQKRLCSRAYFSR